MLARLEDRESDRRIDNIVALEQQAFR